MPPADGACQALETIKNDSAGHLVVSDIVMPEMKGTRLIGEVALLSPQTASLLMTDHGINAVDVPDGVPVLDESFATRELLSVVQASLAQSVQLSAEIRHECERSAKLLRRSKRLFSEVAETVRKARELRRSR
jgi:DNA-binding NtrC family response regulator